MGKFIKVIQFCQKVRNGCLTKAGNRIQQILPLFKMRILFNQIGNLFSDFFNFLI